jgi:hypothetical protein
MKLKTVMQDRPDLIESELSGLAFDSLQQVFRSPDLDIMFTQRAPPLSMNEAIHLFIDPAAGGPGSDYAVLSVCRQKGLITVRQRRLHLLQLPALLQGRGARFPKVARGGQHLAVADGLHAHAVLPAQRHAVLPAQLHACHEPGKHFITGKSTALI